MTKSRVLCTAGRPRFDAPAGGAGLKALANCWGNCLGHLLLLVCKESHVVTLGKGVFMSLSVKMTLSKGESNIHALMSVVSFKSHSQAKGYLGICSLCSLV